IHIVKPIGDDVERVLVAPIATAIDAKIDAAPIEWRRRRRSLHRHREIGSSGRTRKSGRKDQRGYSHPCAHVSSPWWTSAAQGCHRKLRLVSGDRLWHQIFGPVCLAGHTRRRWENRHARSWIGYFSGRIRAVLMMAIAPTTNSRRKWRDVPCCSITLDTVPDNRRGRRT